MMKQQTWNDILAMIKVRDQHGWQEARSHATAQESEAVLERAVLRLTY
jgi:hypothetical protein